MIVLAVIEQNNAWFDSLKDQTAQMLSASPQFFAIISVLMMSPLLAFSVYLIREGNRICRAQRFPAPGQVVIRDTEILEGKPAIRRSRVMQILALILMICALPLTILITSLFNVLIGR